MLLSCYLGRQKNKGFFSSWKLLSYGCLFFFTQAFNLVYAEKYEAHDLYEYVKLNKRAPLFIDDINVMSAIYGQTALHLAVINDDLESASILLEKGADVHRAQYLIKKQVGSVLHCVKSVEVAKLLLDYGADINSQEFFDRTTPLLQAVLRQDKDLIEFFLEQGADVNKGAVRENDWWFFITQELVFAFFVSTYPSALWQQFPSSLAETLVMVIPITAFALNFQLLQQSGWVSEPMQWVIGLVGLPLSICCGSRAIADEEGGLIERMEYELSKLGLPPTKAEQLPILAAIVLKDNKVIDMLLEHGADLNVTNKEFREALAQAIMTHRKDEDAGIEVMQHLIEKGADVNKKHKKLFSLGTWVEYDKDRFLDRYDSALDLARQLKCDKMAEFLLEQGASDIDLEEQAHKPDALGSSHDNDRLKPKAHRPVRDVKLRKPVFTTPRLAPVIHKPNWVSLR